VQAAYNEAHGIQPVTIVKGIRDINDRLRAVAEQRGAYEAAQGAREADLSAMSRSEIERLVAQMETEMRAAARELDFERAATLRDEVREIRLRVLDEDASVEVGRAAERAASAVGPGRGGRRRAGGGQGAGGGGDGKGAPGLHVTAVTVRTADEEAAGSGDGAPGSAFGQEGTASDWFPGIRDEHDEEGGWQAKWLDRPTWDHRVTPNVVRRKGQRPRRG